MGTEKWKIVTNNTHPPSFKKVWVSYFAKDDPTQQYQAYVKFEGREKKNNLIWRDLATNTIIDTQKLVITHWRNIPDNPILPKNFIC
jgi:hypothetical protein